MSVLPEVMQVRDYGKVRIRLADSILHSMLTLDRSARGQNIPILRTKIRVAQVGELPLEVLGNRLSHKADQEVNSSKGAGTVRVFLDAHGYS